MGGLVTRLISGLTARLLPDLHQRPREALPALQVRRSIVHLVVSQSMAAVPLPTRIPSWWSRRLSRFISGPPAPAPDERNDQVILLENSPIIRYQA